MMLRQKLGLAAFGFVGATAAGALWIANRKTRNNIDNPLRLRTAMVSLRSEAPPSFNPNFIADAVQDVLDKVVNIVVPLDSNSGYFARKANLISSGSGFFISKDGTILTNAHVVADISPESTVSVTTSDGTKYDGFVFSLDPYSDLAVIKLINSGNQVWSPVKFGDWVVAVGSPLGLQNTVTAGVVSSQRRNKNEIGSEGIEKDGRVDYIQTDCVVHAGSSGGPLLNLKGEVIGLVTTRAAENEGITQQLMTTGRVIRPWLGLRMVSLTPSIIQQLGSTETLVRSTGVLVTSVFTGSPAELGGLLEGDVVYKINGKAITKTYEFLRVLGHKIGEPVQLNIERKVPLDVDWDGRVTNYTQEEKIILIRPEDMNLKDTGINFH